MVHRKGGMWGSAKFLVPETIMRPGNPRQKAECQQGFKHDCLRLKHGGERESMLITSVFPKYTFLFAV